MGTPISLRTTRLILLIAWPLSLLAAGAMWSDEAARLPSAGAAETTLVRFAVIGDYGRASFQEGDVANLVRSWNPDFIITTGDNNYDEGQQATIDANIGQYYHDFIYPYVGIYGAGAPYNKFFPSLGNHDWYTPGAQPYLNYFTLPGNERYYDFVQGPVHLFAVDSDANEPHGITSTSIQAGWLQEGLSKSESPWKLVYLHHPPYSSGVNHGSHPTLQWPYQQWGATAVLAGHDHTYERILRNGFPYFVNGLGGRSIYDFRFPPIAGSEVRYNGNYGAQLVEADTGYITFQFYSRANVLVDTYTINAPAPTPTRTPTSAATATSTPAQPTDTPTPAGTRTVTHTPEPLLVGHVTWQGPPDQPHHLQQLLITLTLSLSTTQTTYPNQTTDAGGYFTVSLAGLEGGTYEWWVKGPRYLANSGAVSFEHLNVGTLERSKSQDGNVQTFKAPRGYPNVQTISAEMGLMRTGDANDDNVVDVLDFNILKNTFGTSSGDPGYDLRADFNRDDTVDVLDFNFLKGNFGEQGAL